jgi:hypothetical protein
VSNIAHSVRVQYCSLASITVEHQPRAASIADRCFHLQSMRALKPDTTRTRWLRPLTAHEPVIESIAIRDDKSQRHS